MNFIWFSQVTTYSFFFQPLKNVKSILSPQAPQKQMAMVCWPLRYATEEVRNSPKEVRDSHFIKSSKSHFLGNILSRGIVLSINAQGQNQVDEVIPHFSHSSWKTGWEKSMRVRGELTRSCLYDRDLDFRLCLLLGQSRAEPCSSVCPHTIH